jgi:hypothetical protein
MSRNLSLGHYSLETRDTFENGVSPRRIKEDYVICFERADRNEYPFGLTLEDKGFESKPLKPHTKLGFRVRTSTRNLYSIRAETFALASLKSAKINTLESLSTYLLIYRMLSIYL